jgi:hexosaminidase
VEANPPKDALVFAWRGTERVTAALEAGHRVVAVPQTFVYLDYAESDAVDEPLAIGGPVPLSRVMSFKLVPPGFEGRVVGTQGMLWSEYTPTPEMVEWRAWPRLAGIADLAWSRHPRFTETVDVHRGRLRALGINVHP